MTKKQEINYFNLKKFLEGRDFRSLSKEEQLKICEDILKKISQASTDLSETTPTDSQSE